VNWIRKILGQMMVYRILNLLNRQEGKKCIKTETRRLTLEDIPLITLKPLINNK
jgi:hypothetical protein